MLLRKFIDFLGILLGSLITALGVSALLIPNKIAAGGASGVATILYHLFSWSPGVILLCINVPLLILSGFLVSWKFSLNSVVGALATSLFVMYFEGMAPLTTDPLLATLFGGIISGIGVGIVFRSNGSTGGSDLLARIITKYTPITLGQSFIIIDVIIVASAGFLFSPEYIMYALIGLYLCARVIDIVQEGISYTKQVTIISNRIEEITDEILDKLSRGVTHLYSRGGYTKQDKLSAFVIIRRNELASVKRLIKDIDPDAFVIVSDVHQVLGEGFQKNIAEEV